MQQPIHEHLYLTIFVQQDFSSREELQFNSSKFLSLVSPRSSKSFLTVYISIHIFIMPILAIKNEVLRTASRM